jgi:hypothetical protein
MATGALVQGLQHRGKSHKLPEDWFGQFLSNIRVRVGRAYRDQEPLSPQRSIALEADNLT